MELEGLIELSEPDGHDVFIGTHIADEFAGISRLNANEPDLLTTEAELEGAILCRIPQGRRTLPKQF